MLTAFKRVGVAVLFVALFSGDGTGQTVITEPKNKYTPAE